MLTFPHKVSLTLFIRMFTTGLILSGSDSVGHSDQLFLILGVLGLRFGVGNGRTFMVASGHYEV